MIIETTRQTKKFVCSSTFFPDSFFSIKVNMLKTSLMINYRPISIFPSYPKYLKGLCIDYINISQNTTYYTVSSLETMRKPNEKTIIWSKRWKKYSIYECNFNVHSTLIQTFKQHSHSSSLHVIKKFFLSTRSVLNLLLSDIIFQFFVLLIVTPGLLLQ